MAAPQKTEISEKSPTYGLLDVFRNTDGHRVKVLLGVLLSILRGWELTFVALIHLPAFNLLNEKPEHYGHDLGAVCGYFLGLGVYAWMLICSAILVCGWSSECVVNGLQVRALKTQLDEDAAHFDEAENSHAKVVTRLSTDAGNVKAALDNNLVQLVNNMSAMISGLALTLVMCWQIGLVIAALNLILLSLLLAFSARIQSLSDKRTQEDKSSQLTLETLEQARTIQLLTAEGHFRGLYEKALEINCGYTKRIAIPESINFALSQAFQFVSDLSGFSIGIPLVYQGKVATNHVFTATTLASFAGWATVFASPAFTTIIRASPAANSLFNLVFSRNPKDLTAGSKPAFQGNVNVVDVRFTYPNRREAPAADGLTLKARAGEKIALVGASGSGKSTVVQLLERFYTYEKGQIKLDDNRLEEISLKHLRTSMALVGQEPVLFRGSILENLTLGVETSTLEEVEEACRLANAHSFVTSLPNRFDEEIGERGGRLSGGQRQRLALARALLRKPKILLLDEATSALDAESEKMVEEALKSASEGRTCISIAHRLSTVQDADRIYVLEQGRVVEQGTHADLLAKRGHYYRLARAQNVHQDDE